MGKPIDQAQFLPENVSPSFMKVLMSQKNNEPEPRKGLWHAIKTVKRKTIVLAFAGAAAVGAQGIDQADIALRESMMGRSDWKTQGGIRITGEKDHHKFYFFGPVTGQTKQSYFITNDGKAKARPGEIKIVTDYPYEILTKASDIANDFDRIADVSGNFERTITGQRGMNGQMNTPVNGIRINLEGMGKTPGEVSRNLDVLAFDALETQVKTVGIAHTYPVYRHQIWEQQIHLRNFFIEAQGKAEVKMADIKAGWDVMWNGRKTEEPGLTQP